jgi:hypothetical protein
MTRYTVRKTRCTVHPERYTMNGTRYTFKLRPERYYVYRASNCDSNTVYRASDKVYRPQDKVYVTFKLHEQSQDKVYLQESSSCMMQVHEQPQDKLHEHFSLVTAWTRLKARCSD